MDSHFPIIKGISTVSAWRFSSADFESLSWHSDWSFDLDLFRSFDILLSDFSLFEKIAAKVLQRLDLGKANDDRIFLLRNLLCDFDVFLFVFFDFVCGHVLYGL